MALLINSLTVTKAQFFAGVQLTALQGDGGGTVPVAVHLFATASGLPDDAFTEMTLYTSSPIDSATGVSGGVIGVDKLLTNSGDDKLYTGSGGAFRNYANGIWAGVIQGNLVGEGVDDSTPIELSIQVLCDVIGDFTGPAEPPTTPTNIEINEADPGDDQQEVTLSWDTAGDEDGSIISIDDGTTVTVIGATPPNTTTEIPIVLPPGLTGPITIIVQTYIGPPGNISPQATIPLTIPASIPPPFEGDLTIDVTLESPMQVIGDPSGIYVLVPGKTHDTLYERAAGVTTSQNVPIPRPFGKVTYVPEDE